MAEETPAWALSALAENREGIVVSRARLNKRRGSDDA
jgi:hypothetical protein